MKTQFNFSFAHQESNFSMQKPEYRLISSWGQDRSVNTFLISEHARTTDKGNLPRLDIQSGLIL